MPFREHNSALLHSTLQVSHQIPPCSIQRSLISSISWLRFCSQRRKWDPGGRITELETAQHHLAIPHHYDDQRALKPVPMLQHSIANARPVFSLSYCLRSTVSLVPPAIAPVTTSCICIRPVAAKLHVQLLLQRILHTRCRRAR